ncbi:MAG: 3-oxoacyl-[acyl-carrier-protein] synthase III C-terminal domain-containing protein [Prosthecobacter sp.]|nr:3-oxoacyl-[acyl-carrier-protein] synthase III C-terminal domain-containing protein [Prosthecobacter sp.]
MNDGTSSIGLRAHRALLPERFLPLEAISLRSKAESLADLGFAGAWISDDVSNLARDAARLALQEAKLNPEDIDALLWVSALPEAHQRASSVAADPALGPDVLAAFCYQGSWLQETLGLDRAFVSGVAQQGCAGMFTALRQARALLVAEPQLKHVLCVGADRLPSGVSREVLYNVISDAACAVIVSRDALCYRWLGYQQVSRGYYWDVPARQSEIIAAYFPTASLTIRRLLQDQVLRPEEIDWVIPTGVSAASWPILMRLCGIPEDRLYQPQRRFGHTIAADSFLILEEARAAGALQPGQKLLLFAYGFGSSWAALLLETTDFINS